MKKITLFAVLTTLLSWTGIIQAQTPNMPETSTSDNPKYYLIKSYRSNGYLTANPSGTATHEQLANITANSIWYFVGNISSVSAGETTTNQFVGKIGNEGVEGKFLTSVGTNCMDETGTDWYVRAHKFPTNPSPNGLAISIDAGLSSNIDANNHNNGTGMYGGTETDCDGTTWNVIPLETALAEFAGQITEINTTLQETLNEVKSLVDEAKTTTGTIGSYTDEAITTLENIYNANTTAGSTDNAKLHQILILRAAIANFKASPIIKPTEGYYRLKCMYGSNYLAVNTFGMNQSKSKNILIVDADKENPSLESVWKLEYLDESQSSFSLMNVATGEYIDNVYGTSGVNTCLKPKAMSFTYNYKKGGTVSDGGIDVPVPAGSIAIKGSNYTVFFGGSDISNYWDGIGSVWSIESVAESDLDIYITDETIVKLDQYFEEPVVKRIYSLNDFKPAFAVNEKEQLNKNKNYVNYAAYMVAVYNTVSQIDENALYYIVSAYQAFNDGIDRYVYVDTDNSLKWTKSKNNEVSMLWKITSNPDDYNKNGYNITSINYNKNIKTAGWSGTASTTDDAYSISISPSPVMNAKDGGVQLIHWHANANPSVVEPDRQTLALNGATLAQPTTDEDNKGLTGYNSSEANYATHFLLVRAESVNLNTTATTDGNWSTTYLPIAVQLPAGATAYYVSAATNGIATLKENAENKIAAEEGVVIKSDEAGTIAATILTEEVSKQDNNLLKGSLTGIAVPDNAYVLADDVKGIGFYKINPTSNLLAGNKAYLEVPVSLSGVKAFTFDFGGTTGIDNPETAVEAEEYYDLQGRRVMNPTKGIYVTKSGKKVLFTK